MKLPENTLFIGRILLPLPPPIRERNTMHHVDNRDSLRSMSARVPEYQTARLPDSQTPRTPLVNDPAKGQRVVICRCQCLSTQLARTPRATSYIKMASWKLQLLRCNDTSSPPFDIQIKS